MPPLPMFTLLLLSEFLQALAEDIDNNVKDGQYYELHPTPGLVYVEALRDGAKLLREVDANSRPG